ncbi:DUF6907 domain-containing protein [Streptomyces sp. SYSU K21746]
MTAARTVTVQTIDHGDVVLTCPAWCAGHDETPQYRIDISHFGPEMEFTAETSRGTVTTMIAAFEQRPYIGDKFPGTAPLVWMGIDGDGYPSNPEQLDQLAATLVEHAAQLRHLARELTVLRAVQA